MKRAMTCSLPVAFVILGWSAVPAPAQHDSFRCNYPFGDHSLGVLATNRGSESKTCRVTCLAKNQDDDTGLGWWTVTCEGEVRAGAADDQMCSRGGYQGGPLVNAQVQDSTRCN